MQYRASFALFLVSQVAITILDLVTILAVFSKVHALGGWTRTQVVVLYGVSSTAFGLADAAVSPVELTAQWVRLGTFDRLLLRPAGSLAQLLGHEFELRRIGRALQPVVALAVGLGLVHVHLTIAHVVLLLGGVAGSAVLFGALFVLTSSIAFWTPNTQEVANAFTYGSNVASTYPAHIFAEWLRRFLLGVIPLGLTAYGPVLVVLDAPNPLHLSRPLLAAGPLVAIPFVAFAAVAWRAGNRHYCSTGS
jgi:ABC-2 type transport system permease protein